MLTYLHIGYLKNFSTSLQRSFFSNHPELYHLGAGIDSNIGYLDATLSAIFEVYLKTSKLFKYKEQKQRLEAHIRDHKAKASTLNKYEDRSYFYDLRYDLVYEELFKLAPKLYDKAKHFYSTSNITLVQKIEQNSTSCLHRELI